MNKLHRFLVISTVVIYLVTIIAITNNGWWWPLVYFGDIFAFDWRSQFNTDFLIHLFLLATWIAWREGFTNKGYVFGFLSIVMGGMFGFPYIAYAIYRANGDPKKVLLGKHQHS